MNAMRTFVAVALLALCGCTKSAPSEAPLPSPSDEGDGCEHITVLKQVMACELAPFMSGQKGDEAAFRRALAQIRELAPPGSNYNSGEQPWYAIVDKMLAGHEYRPGCRACHQQFLKPYRRDYGGTPIPWQDVATPTAAK